MNRRVLSCATSFLLTLVIVAFCGFQIKAGMSAQTAKSKLGEYSSWIVSESDGYVKLNCPDKDVSEDYLIELVNNISDDLSGKIGDDYCEIEVNFEYTVEENGTSFDTFSNKMFEIERALNIGWPEWSGRNSLNFVVGYYYDSDGVITEYVVVAKITVNGQAEDSEYVQYNELLQEIVTACENECSGNYERVQYYCDWIVSNIVYDAAYGTTNSACDALINKKAVCGGFANLLRDLCNMSGIPAIVTKSEELNHAWNEVCIDTQWYTVDLLNYVSSKSNSYEYEYLFTDPDAESDYSETVEKIKNELYVFSFPCEDGLTWKLNGNHKLKFVGNGDMQDFDWVETFPSWFDYSPEVTKLYISSGITSIGDYAFADYYELDNITEVYLPDTLVDIGVGAFSGCDGIENIYFNGTQEQWDKINIDYTENEILNSIVPTVNLAHTHNYGEWIISSSPTCTENGLKYKVCDGCGERVEEAIISSGHKYSDTVTAPTCTSQGYTTHTCTCGDTYIDSYVNANGHDMGDWITVNEATCTETGTRIRLCNDCGYSENETVPVKEHSYDSEWTVDINATCTENGSKSRHCKNCTAVTDVTEITSQGHKYEDSVIVPTCSTGGYTVHTCSVCNDSYNDDFKTSLGHSFSVWNTVTEAKCEDKGKESRVCSVCNAEEYRTTNALGHAYSTEWITDLEATCTVNGSKSRHCSRCDSVTDITPIIAEGHKYSESVTKPTCIDGGYTVFTCTCGDTYTGNYKSALGHSFGDWVVVVNPTCEDKGEEVRKCSVCTAEESREVAPLNHDYADKFTVDLEATCTVNGSKSRHCSRCDSITDVTPIIAEGHKYSENVTKPTCIDGGYTVFTCACGDTYTGNYKSALGHSFGDWVSVVNPTCEDKGEEVRKCSVCTAEERRELTPLNHDYADKFTVDIEATCTVNGSKSRHCSRCESVTDITPIIAEGHKYSESVTPPTCLENGVIEYTCFCGDGYTEEILTTGHSYNDFWTVDFDSTCTTVGSESRHCSVCGSKTDIRTIEIKEHDYAVTVFEPTCTDGGYTYHKCRNCENAYSDSYTNPNGHSFTYYKPNNDAGCLSDETATAECDNCDKTDTVVIPDSAKGHKVVIDSAVQATCQSSGLTEGKHCSECGEILVAQSVTEQLEHIDGDKDTFCDNCEQKISDGYEECDCICHSDGIRGFFYKLLKFFWKLFGTNKTCQCGKYHY